MTVEERSSRRRGGMKMKKREIGRPGPGAALQCWLGPSRELDKHSTPSSRVVLLQNTGPHCCRVISSSFGAIVLCRGHYQSFESILVIQSPTGKQIHRVASKRHCTGSLGKWRACCPSLKETEAELARGLLKPHKKRRAGSITLSENSNSWRSASR